MPVAEGVYQCNFCEDIFNANSNEFSKCKCGKSEIELSYFGYSYKRGSEVTKIEHNSYYLKDEFVRLPEDIQAIFDKIKDIKEANGYKYYLYEMTERGKNDEKYISQIIISYSESVSQFSSEQNEISLTIHLKKGDYDGHDTTRNKLQKFLDMMEGIESGTLNVSNRREMVALADSENIHYFKEPTGDTNYKFYL